MVRRDPEPRGECSQLYWRCTRTLLTRVIVRTAHLLSPQDPSRPGTHRRTQERPRHHRAAQISRPVRHKSLLSTGWPLVADVNRSSCRIHERTGSSTSSWTTSACKTRSGIPIWCVLPARDYSPYLHRDLNFKGDNALMGGSVCLSVAQMAVRSCFIRGSTVRYVQLPRAAVDTQLLEDATRRGAFAESLPECLLRF